MNILGFRDLKNQSSIELLKLSNSFKIDENNSYKIDSKLYNSLSKIKTLSDAEKKNIEQPNQIVIFDSNDINVTYLINCNIGGFPFLKWNRFNGFDSIPIKQGYFRNVSNGLTKNEIESIIVPLKKNIQKSKMKPSYTYYIFWSRILFRNSKKMIKEIKRNLKLAKKENIDIEVKFIFSEGIYF